MVNTINIVRIRRVVLLALWLVGGGLAQAQTQAQASSAPRALEPVQVLFIGNSYTFYHRMPDTVAAMAQSATSPRPLQVQVVAVSAATLARHWKSAAVQNALRARTWDYVVLQEQSVLPLKQRQRMYTAVRLFDQAIKRSGARTVLFLTWARRDQSETQAALNAAYDALAEELGALIASVGQAWQIARERAPDVPLYAKDGSHPTAAGAYLSACVLYLTLQAQATFCPAPQNSGVAMPVINRLRAAAAAALDTPGH